jgi:hypothetical protein
MRRASGNGGHLVRNLAITPTVAIFGIWLAAAPTHAQTAQSAPEQSSLVVGALQIGSAADLEVEGIDINVTIGSVVYSYLLKNAGERELNLTASVSMPELRASSDGTQTWVLASNNPENPVSLAVTAAGEPVTPKADVHAYALALDRTAEIRAARLPLIPFGPETDRTLAALPPDAVGRLAALGIISPRDPDQPKGSLTADWSLDSVLSWQQALPPGKDVPIVVRFAPVKAEYRLLQADLDDLDSMKDEICLQPQVLTALQSRLKSGAAWKVIDMSLAVDGPAHWIDNPAPSLSVQKPQPDAIVAFCGMDDKTANRPTVLGVTPDDTDEVRVVIFAPAAK